MIYPMPENMGFPLSSSSSISDMLPDEPLVEPERQRGRYGKDIHVGLNEYTCAGCGKRFTATAEHKYKAENQPKGKNKRIDYYCSYPCFRPIERAAQEKFRSEALGFVNGYGRDKSPLERARQRVEKCEKKLKELLAIRHDPAAWQALPIKKRRNVTSSIGVWRAKLDEARAALKEVEAYEAM